MKRKDRKPLERALKTARDKREFAEPLPSIGKLPFALGLPPKKGLCVQGGSPILLLSLLKAFCYGLLKGFLSFFEKFFVKGFLSLLFKAF